MWARPTPLLVKPIRTVCAILVGTINKKAPKACYIEKWADWQWLPGAIEAIVMLKKAGYRLLVISNQAGIARGKMTEDDLADIHQQMLADIRVAGGDIDKIYYCPHGWNDGCASP